MVKSRRLSVNTYNEKTADEVVDDIVHVYYNLFIKLQTRLDLENLSA